MEIGKNHIILFLKQPEHMSSSSDDDLRSFFAMVRAARSKARVEERVAERLYQTRTKPDTRDQVLEAAGAFLPPGESLETTTTTCILRQAALAIFRHHHNSSSTKRERKDEEEDDDDDDEEEKEEGEDVDREDGDDLEDLQDRVDAHDELLLNMRAKLQKLTKQVTNLAKHARTN